MNALENWFCGSALWRFMTRRQLLPWLVHGAQLGEHILEIGAGRGTATAELARRAPKVTSLEYDPKSLAILRARVPNSNVEAIQGDASELPFPDGSFSSAIAILMLHHLKSSELQDRAFREIRRVLRPSGVFLAIDIPDGWVHRVAHIKSTFVPVDPAKATARLTLAGFPDVGVDFRHGAFRIQALRAPKS